MANSELRQQSVQQPTTTIPDRIDCTGRTRRIIRYVPICTVASPNSRFSLFRVSSSALFILVSVLLHTRCCRGFLPSNGFDWYRLYDRATTTAASRIIYKQSRNGVPVLPIAGLFSSPPPFDYSAYNYYYTTEKSRLENDGGVAYRQSVCTPREMESMRDEVSRIVKRRLTKERSSIAQHRLGATLSKSNACETMRILEEGSIHALVQRLGSTSNSKGSKGEVNNGKKSIHLATELPVEVRSYEQVGAAMAWHKDDVLYDPPQLEVVFTLENNSDCVTMWVRDDDGDGGANSNSNSNSNKRIQSQETHPNSMLLLLAGGPDHCVTSLKRGRRVIVKCAYVYEGATYVGEDDHNQFGAASTKAKGNAKKTSKSRKKNAKR
eukprot:jgi/Psemu1/190108/e_gw1.96.47.1